MIKDGHCIESCMFKSLIKFSDVALGLNTNILSRVYVCDHSVARSQPVLCAFYYFRLDRNTEMPGVDRAQTSLGHVGTQFNSPFYYEHRYHLLSCPALRLCFTRQTNAVACFPSSSNGESTIKLSAAGARRIVCMLFDNVNDLCVTKEEPCTAPPAYSDKSFPQQSSPAAADRAHPAGEESKLIR